MSRASAIYKIIDEHDLEPFLQIFKNRWSSSWATRFSPLKLPLHFVLRTEDAVAKKIGMPAKYRAGQQARTRTRTLRERFFFLRASYLNRV